MPQTVVVVPTIREECIREFLAAWQFPAEKVLVIVIEDNAERSFNLGDYPNVVHYAHSDIEKDLGERAWIIPRKTDCVRSYGFYKAWQLKPEMIVTLDDDCFPESRNWLLDEHLHALNADVYQNRWVNTLENYHPRGFPYESDFQKRRTVLNHGLWVNVPDFDAVTQLAHKRNEPDNGVVFRYQSIPPSMYFPMCGMNLAFRPEAVPALYFLLMGKDYPYDRFGDIWAGIFFKRICDHLGCSVRSGIPFVHHKRASNVWANLRKEAPGMEVNETLWQTVDAIPLHGTTFKQCYIELAEGLDARMDGYWDKLTQAMCLWASLFSE